MFVSFINEISSLSSIIIKNLCTYSKYLQTYYGINLKISSLKTNGIFKIVMYETNALDYFSFEVHVKCFMRVLKKIKITHVIYALDLQLIVPLQVGQYGHHSQVELLERLWFLVANFLLIRSYDWIILQLCFNLNHVVICGILYAIYATIVMLMTIWLIIID
jgi:hypothetical protein